MILPLETSPLWWYKFTFASFKGIAAIRLIRDKTVRAVRLNLTTETFNWSGGDVQSHFTQSGVITTYSMSLNESLKPITSFTSEIPSSTWLRVMILMMRMRHVPSGNSYPYTCSYTGLLFVFYIADGILRTKIFFLSIIVHFLFRKCWLTLFLLSRCFHLIFLMIVPVLQKTFKI